MFINTIGKNKFTATFNRRRIQIENEADTKVVDLATGEIVDGDELRSIRNLVLWHIQSKLDSNELPTLWTVKA